MDYACAMDLDADQTDDLVYFVRKMDREFLDWHEKKYGDKNKRGGVLPADETGGRRRGLGRRA